MRRWSSPRVAHARRSECSDAGADSSFVQGLAEVHIAAQPVLAVPSIITLPASPSPTKRDAPFHFVAKRDSAPLVVVSVSKEPAAAPATAALPDPQPADRSEQLFHFVNKRQDSGIHASSLASAVSTAEAAAPVAKVAAAPANGKAAAVPKAEAAGKAEGTAAPAKSNGKKKSKYTEAKGPFVERK